MQWRKCGSYPWKYHWYNNIELKEKCEKLFKEFSSYFEVDEVALAEDTVMDYTKLLNGDRTYNHAKKYSSYDEKVPNKDHAALFKKHGTDHILYVNQPYAFDEARLKVWCEKCNLLYVICGKERSFWNPGHTDMILIMSQDTYEYYQSVKKNFPTYWEGKRK